MRILQIRNCTSCQLRLLNWDQVDFYCEYWIVVCILWSCRQGILCILLTLLYYILYLLTCCLLCYITSYNCLHVPYFVFVGVDESLRFDSGFLALSVGAVIYLTILMTVTDVIGWSRNGSTRSIIHHFKVLRLKAFCWAVKNMLLCWKEIKNIPMFHNCKCKLTSLQARLSNCIQFKQL